MQLLILLFVTGIVFPLYTIRSALSNAAHISEKRYLASRATYNPCNEDQNKTIGETAAQLELMTQQALLASESSTTGASAEHVFVKWFRTDDVSTRTTVYGHFHRLFFEAMSTTSPNYVPSIYQVHIECASGFDDNCSGLKLGYVHVTKHIVLVSPLTSASDNPTSLLTLRSAVASFSCLFMHLVAMKTNRTLCMWTGRRVFFDFLRPVA